MVFFPATLPAGQSPGSLFHERPEQPGPMSRPFGDADRRRGGMYTTRKTPSMQQAQGSPDDRKDREIDLGRGTGRRKGAFLPAPQWLDLSTEITENV